MSTFSLSDLLEWIVISGVVLLIVFVVLRELWCWYWKLNRIVSLLESIDKKLDGAEVSSEVRK